VTVEEPNLQAVKPARLTVFKDQFKRLPIIFSLIGFTLLVFLAQMLSNRLLGIDLLLVFGAKINEAIAGGELWRLVTPIFIHVDLWHFFLLSRWNHRGALQPGIQPKPICGRLGFNFWSAGGFRSISICPPEIFWECSSSTTAPGDLRSSA
jgi:hypothetical protein